MNESPRVLVVQRALPHYRGPVFEELERRFPGRMTIVSAEGLPSDLTPLGMESHVLVHHTRVQRIGWGERELLFQMPGLAGLVRSQRPSVLLVEGNPRIITTWRLPAVCHSLSIACVAWTKFAGPAGRGPRATLWRRYLGLWDAIVSYGQTGKAALPAFGVDPKRVFVAQNTVAVPATERELAQVRQAALERRRDLKLDGRRVIVSLGRLVPEKRFDLAIKALAALKVSHPHTVLVIVGAGPDEGRLRNMARETCRASGMPEDAVRFTGVVPPGHDAIWLALGDIAVLAGAVGLAMNVSMAVGTPTVIADEAGCDTELLKQGEGGLRFAPGDAGHLATLLSSLLSDERARATLGPAGRSVILRSATIQHMVGGIQEAIDHALTERRSRNGGA